MYGTKPKVQGKASPMRKPGCKATLRHNRNLAAATFARPGRKRGQLVLGLQPEEVSWKFGNLAEHPNITPSLSLYLKGTQRKKEAGKKRRHALMTQGRACEIPKTKKRLVFPAPAEAIKGMVLDMRHDNRDPDDLRAWPGCNIKKLLAARRDAANAFQAAKVASCVILQDVKQGFPMRQETDRAVYGAAIAATAFGASYMDKKSWEAGNWNAALHLKGTAETLKLTLQTTARFETKHRDMCALLCRVSCVEKSGWKLLSSDKPKPRSNVHSIDNLVDLVKFLHQAQRVRGPANVGGSHFA